jgi:hypothetical protein
MFDRCMLACKRCSRPSRSSSRYIQIQARGKCWAHSDRFLSRATFHAAFRSGQSLVRVRDNIQFVIPDWMFDSVAAAGSHAHLAATQEPVLRRCVRVGAIQGNDHRLRWPGQARRTTQKADEQMDCADSRSSSRIHYLGGVPGEPTDDDREIARLLNRLGYRTGRGNSWQASRVADVRCHYRLPSYEKRSDWLTMQQAAKELRVGTTVIKRLLDERKPDHRVDSKKQPANA